METLNNRVIIEGMGITEALLSVAVIESKMTRRFLADGMNIFTFAGFLCNRSPKSYLGNTLAHTHSTYTHTH